MNDEAPTEQFDQEGYPARSPVVTAMLSPLSQRYPSSEARAMVAEIAALREEVARLQQELAEARAAAMASEATELSHTLLTYVLDVLCALLLPQRGHCIIFDLGESALFRESKETRSTVGPLQMALERPSLDRALHGHATRLTTRYESVIWIPIKHDADVAVIICLRRAPINPFSVRDQEFAEVLAPLLISALQAGHRLFDLNADRDALRALGSTLNARIRLGGDRIAGMAYDADRLAQSFNLIQREHGSVRLGAILHDIGTVDLAEDLLQKEGPLSSDEVVQMREHPAFGAEILRHVSGMDEVIPLVRHHHERWDGTGYPAGLAGGEIPLGSRIIAVVDAFHAMTSPRSYRQPCTSDEALVELRRCVGTQFDPVVVEEFTRLIRSGA